MSQLADYLKFTTTLYSKQKYLENEKATGFQIEDSVAAYARIEEESRLKILELQEEFDFGAEN